MLAQRCVEAEKYTIRTHMVAQVVSYDLERNTVDVQPVVNAVRTTDAENMTTVQRPLITKVPVSLTGSGKLFCSFAPQVGTYGILHVCDRIIDDWKAAGGIVDPSDIRCHNPSDAIFYHSVLPFVEDGDNGLFGTEEEVLKTDRISLRTRAGTTEISVIVAGDDGEEESILITNTNASIAIDKEGKLDITVTDKLTASIDKDGNVSLTTEGTLTASVDGDISMESTGGGVSVTADGDVSVEAGGDVSVTSGGTVSLDNGSGTIEIAASGQVSLNGNLTVDP